VCKTMCVSLQWDQKLLAGTEEGAVMILEEQEASHLVEFALLDTKKNFAKRPIVQMQV
jgi:hypothetical protein